MPLRSFKEPHSVVATVASDQLDAASFGSRSFGLARLEKDVDAAKYTSNVYSSHRKEIVRMHSWLHTSGFSSSPAEARISSKISRRLGGFHHYDPQKGVYIFDFLPIFFIAVTVNRVAEKHFELLFSAGNSDTVHIRPSKIPYIWATYFEALFGSPGLNRRRAYQTRMPEWPRKSKKRSNVARSSVS